MEITTEISNNICYCKICGRLDGSTSAQAEEQLNEIQGRNPNQPMVLELQELEYLSSAGLRVFLIAAKKAKSQSSELHLCSPASNVEEVLQISGFTSILPLHADRAAAEKALLH